MSVGSKERAQRRGKAEKGSRQESVTQNRDKESSGSSVGEGKGVRQS